MVEGPGSVGPRNRGRGSWAPYRVKLAEGKLNEAAVSFSTTARRCMYRARIGDWQKAIDWLEQSIEPRTKAIQLYLQVGRRTDAARDRSFLGKAFARLGVMLKDNRRLARAVFERTLALELFRELNLVDSEGNELSYLAEDFRAMGWHENYPRLKSYLYLKAAGYSEAALDLYARYLSGKDLEERTLLEKGYIALARGCSALCVNDREEVRSAKDRCHSLADRLIKYGLFDQGHQLRNIARALDALLFKLRFLVSP